MAVVTGPENFPSPTPSARPRPGAPDQPRKKPTICHMASKPRQPGITGSPMKWQGEDPQLRVDIHFGDALALAVGAAGRIDLDDAVHHQHRRYGQLGVVRPEQ